MSVATCLLLFHKKNICIKLEEMELCLKSLSRVTAPLISLFLLLSCSGFTSTEAYEALDPDGNITIKWDVISWTPDGYVAVVTIYNNQQYRHIQVPGWTLGWTWAKKEVIWNLIGALTTEQGDCSKFKGNVPYSCNKSPRVVDLLPGTPYNQQVANCCKAGVISTRVQDPANAASSFQISVGGAGTNSKTVKLPVNFTLKAPGPGYTCGPARVVRPTRFVSKDGRRMTVAAMTWNVTCTYSQFLAPKTPVCCVSLSSFNNDTAVSCPTCSCGCQKNGTQQNICVNPKLPYHPKRNSFAPVVQCTSHMCPIRVNWHVKANYKNYWRVKITITNFNYQMNYTQWNLVIQHPNFDNLSRKYDLNYKPLTPYSNINNTGMLWGVKSYNDLLVQAGKLGNVRSGELLFRKDSKFRGWALPRRIYFNGDMCVMPSPKA